MSTTSPPISFVRTPGRLSPTRVAERTYLVHQVVDLAGLPISVYNNAGVIQADQPVLVDTGSRYNRAQWLKDVFSLVDPSEVRWVFVSHADPDHTGNLDAVLEACPNARLVCAALLAEALPTIEGADALFWERPSSGVTTTLNAGDREMVVIRPPWYDSPLTMGLLDTKTGTYWSVDAFYGLVPAGEAVDNLPRDVSELDDQQWNLSMAVMANEMSPWLTLVDDDRFAAEAQQIADLDISIILPTHSPAIAGDKVAETLAKLPRQPAECRSAPSLAAYVGQVGAAAQAVQSEA